MTITDLPFLQTIKQNLGHDDLDTVLFELTTFLQTSGPAHVDEVIQHSGRYETLAKSQRLGTISFENASVELNSIRNGVLMFISQLEKSIRRKDKTNAFSPQPVLKNSLQSSADSPEVQNNILDKAQQLNDEGLQCYDSGDWTGALNLFNQALEIAPNYGIAYSNRGLVKVDLGDFDGAGEDYNLAIRFAPTLSRAWNNRCVLKLDILNDLRGAFDDINKAIALDQQDATAFINRGNAYLQLQDHEKAILDFGKSIELSPGWHEAYLNRGITFQSMGDDESAIGDFNKAIRITPKEAMPYHHLGLSLYKLGQYREAIDSFNTALDINPVIPWGLSLRGLSYFFLGDYVSALADHEKALRVDPEEALNYTNCGSCKNLLGRYQEALQDYLKANELDPASAVNYLGIGTSYQNMEQYEAGIEAMSKAIQIDPNYYVALQSRGQMYYFTNKFPEALKDLTKVLHSEEVDEDTHLFIGLCYYQQNLKNEAAGYIQKCLDLRPDYGPAWYWKGVIHHDFEQTAEAKEAYQKAMLHDPTLWTPFNNMGIILLDEGNIDDAIYYFEQALIAEPDAELARTNLGIAKDRKK